MKKRIILLYSFFLDPAQWLFAGNSPGRKQQRTCEFLCAAGSLGLFLHSSPLFFYLGVFNVFFYAVFMILWTIRHTKPLNINQVCYGRTDFDVSPSFETEYPPALEALKTAKINRLFSSPLLRCKSLAP